MQPVVREEPGMSEAVREMGVPGGQSPQNSTKKEAASFPLLEFLLSSSLFTVNRQ